MCVRLMHTYMYVYICMYMFYICMHACMYVCMHVCIAYIYTSSNDSGADTPDNATPQETARLYGGGSALRSCVPLQQHLHPSASVSIWTALPKQVKQHLPNLSHVKLYYKLCCNVSSHSSSRLCYNVREARIAA